MYANFERHEFLEFFDTEKIFDEETGSVRYTIKLEHNFLFQVSIVAIDSYLSITLRHEGVIEPIFDIGFDGIDQIMLEKTKAATFLVLHKEKVGKAVSSDEASNDPNLRIMIKPSVALQLSI